MERRKLVEQALDVEMERVVKCTKYLAAARRAVGDLVRRQDAADHRSKVEEHFEYLHHLLQQQQDVLMGQVQQALTQSGTHSGTHIGT